jgi:hypothetical protein
MAFIKTKKQKNIGKPTIGSSVQRNPVHKILLLKRNSEKYKLTIRDTAAKRMMLDCNLFKKT